MTNAVHQPKMKSSSRRACSLTDSTLGGCCWKGRAYFALIAIIVVFSLLSPYYFTVSNFLTMSSHVALFGILAIGMLLVILNGGIDLSVGSTLGCPGVVAGFLMQGVTLKACSASCSIRRSGSWRAVRALLAPSIGLINGVLIARFKVPAFVATLGVMYMVRGVALLMTNGLTYNNLGGEAGPRQYRLRLARLQSSGFGIPIGVLVMVVIAVHRQSRAHTAPPFGRWLYASGGNERAAELSGVPVRRRCKCRSTCCPACARHVAGLILSSSADLGGADRGHQL